MVYRPGSTRPFEFILPFKKSAIDKVYLTFKQQEFVLLTVDDEDSIELVEGTRPNSCFMKVKLKQEDSLQLSNYPYCYVQINLITSGNPQERLVSNEIKFNIGEQFYRKIIEGRGENDE